MKQRVVHGRCICLFAAGFSLVLLFVSFTSAQIIPPITSSGLNTQVSAPSTLPSGKVQYDITGGTRPGGGANLFHSFGDFNVPNNNVANLLNESGLATSNILGRVTGGNVSSIFGTIQTTGFGNANLFLMNPAGFLFGPNATVNVGGMVSFTSADYLRLTDNARFNAVPGPADTLLTAAPVAAFGFLGSNPGAITVQGSQFTVTEGTGISLIGGDIKVQNGILENGTVQSARLSAPGGQIQLSSLASAGEVLMSSSETVPLAGGVSLPASGSITVSQGSMLDVSGQTGGQISIRSGQFQIDNATLQSDTVLGDSGDIVIAASAMSMKGGSIQTSTAGPGIAGDIAVDAQTLTMSDGAYMASILLGEGQGGNIRTNAIESIAISGFRPGTTFLGPLPFTNLPSGLYTNTFSGARGGNIDVTTPQLQLQGGFFQTQTFGAGRAGNIVTTVGRLDLTEGGRLASTTFGDGNGGNVTISATDSIHVSGQRQVVFAAGSVVQTNIPGQISSNTRGAGNGGQVSIATPLLEVQTGLILASTSGTGQGGTIVVDVGDLSLTKGASISSNAFGDAPGGSVSVNATGTISISGRSGVTYSIGPTVFENTQSAIDTGTFGAGPSGNVTLSARNLVISDEANIQTSTGGSGPAGTISISVENATLETSGIIASSSGFILGEGLIIGDGQGGQLNLKADTLTVSGQGSGLFTSTVANGNGGKINVDVSRLDLKDGAVLTASAQGPGNAGTVTVQGLAGPAQSVLIDGQGSGIVTETNGTGAGGNTTISAQSLTVQNGGTISAATSGPAPSAAGGNITINADQVQVNSGGLITAATTGAGVGGSVNINAGNTFSSNAGTVRSTATQAKGGDINVSAGQSVTLNSGSNISASSTGTGNAGNIVINAGQNYTSSNSSVTTQAAQASGGNITVLATDLVHLTNSEINASVQGSSTTVGGNILIDPLNVILQNSQVLAQATQGQGGNINIFYSGALLADPSSVISASSQAGVNGTVTVQSPNAPASGKILPLGKSPLQVTSLLSQRCAALAGGEFSSFTMAGRETLPAEPGGWLSAPLAQGFEPPPGTLTEAVDIAHISEQAGQTPLLSLRHISPPGFLTQAFAVDRSTDCAS